MVDYFCVRWCSGYFFFKYKSPVTMGGLFRLTISLKYKVTEKQKDLRTVREIKEEGRGGGGEAGPKSTKRSRHLQDFT